MSRNIDRPILVLRFSSLGDIAMTVPVLRSFFSTYPNQKIIFVSRSYAKPLFDEFSNLEFITVDFNGEYKGLKGLIRLYKKLKKTKAKSVIDLHSVIRTHVLKILFKISFVKVNSIKKSRAERKKLTRKKNKIFKPLTTTHYIYSDAFRKAGFPVDFSNHEYPIKPFLSEESIENQLLSRKKDKPAIGIAPFASFKGKSYPLDLMQKVIAYLQKDHMIYLFGGDNDNLHQLQIWEKAYENVVDVSRSLSLKQQLNLISYLSLMISMDSANGHLAANLGVPVLTIWGMTHPFCGFTPFNQPIENSLTINRNKYPLIPTSIFGEKVPKGYELAIRSIESKEVIEKALELLSLTKPDHS